MLMATLDSTPVGWCQWYRWADYPADAEAIGAHDGEIGRRHHAPMAIYRLSCT